MGMRMGFVGREE
ncbi:hypothetical protein Zm00014a_043032 [Zea mays]|uniref:Uncharacterized protein n=1 Tax=Zea mays TaxID=4577 RepID=A0A3L6F6X6_MAIZE|nr:hypothetical protein Zm00014a_043032 [Zea mays]